MGKPSNTFGYWRQRGTEGATPAVVQAVLKGSFDPTSSSQIELFTLPLGAIPLEMTGLGGATGGTNPTVEVGTAGNDDGFAVEMDADAVNFGETGALTGIELTVDTIVFGKVGTSAATGGTVTVLMNYIIADDGSF